MNLDKELIHIKTGKPYQKSFLTEEEKARALANKKTNGEDSIEKETVANVILNCLSFMPGDTRKEGFYANAIAQLVLGKEREIDLQEKFRQYLIKTLESCIIRVQKTIDNKEEVKGVYSSWVIAQVLEEIGVKEDN